MSIFRNLVIVPDIECKIIDSSTVKAHQHSCGARNGEDHGIGKTADGNIVVDSHANPFDFEITEDQVHDIKMAPELIQGTPKSTYTIADKGYGAGYFRWVIREIKPIPVIPRKENSK